MVLVRPSTPDDVPAQRLLWQLAFGDDGAYVDNFYQTYYRPERVLVLEEEGQVRSMTAWFDTTFLVPGRGSYRAAYLYAVATHPECRGRGLAGRLLAEADEFFRGLGIPAVTTVPAEPSLHNFFGANGFGECFRNFEGALSPSELPAPGAPLLQPASPAGYGAAGRSSWPRCPTSPTLRTPSGIRRDAAPWGPGASSPDRPPPGRCACARRMPGTDWWW